jgi:hypothetical protein
MSGQHAIVIVAVVVIYCAVAFLPARRASKTGADVKHVTVNNVDVNAQRVTRDGQEYVDLIIVHKDMPVVEVIPLAHAVAEGLAGALLGRPVIATPERNGIVR